MDEDKTVAVIGIGGRFPGANDVEEFWQLILNGINPIVEIQSERSAFKDLYISDPNDTETKRAYKAGLIQRLWLWDNKLFSITDQEAEYIDPQQRFVLDCVHMAMENAGLTRKDLDGTNTGVFIGVMNDDFNGMLRDADAETSSYMVTGVNTSIVSARVSYVFNLQGPSMTIDTACSSSLVAIHQGAQALKSGDCDMVICGGVNIILDPLVFKTLSNARMLSPTGQCHSFTNKADGYTRGEGCGIVLLKRTNDVLQTGQKIWGLLGTCVNQDGRMVTPITAPSGEQQIALLRRVYTNFNIPKSSIQVIEAHGTGTTIGDPTECNALGNFFHDENAPTIRYIGSVKSNIGHLESAAGIAGLIKVLLMMHYETIVPSLHVDIEGLHPKNNLTENGLIIPTKPVKWILPNGGTRFGCVNSFGFGGTNAHAIVQEYKKNYVQERNSHLQMRFPVVILLSGTSPDALSENVRRLIEHLNEKEYRLDELSFTSACKRDHFLYRAGFIASSQHELKAKCQIYLNLKDFNTSGRNQNPRIVMVFCGVGTAWPEMCSELTSVKAFETKLFEVDTLLKEHTGWSIVEKMKSNDVIVDPMVSQIAIFTCQVSLFNMWKSCGVTPDVVIGQSVGEVAAAYASEAISLETAVELIYKRSICLSTSTGGKMMVVSGLDISRLQNMCKSQQYYVCVAVHNSPSSATISGDAEGIAAIKNELSRLKEKGEHILSKELPVPCAYHSKHVESAKNDFVKSVLSITGEKPRIPIISTVTGQYAKNGDFITANYWGRNMRDEVQFCESIRMGTSEKTTTLFVEIGPHPVLGPHLQNIFPSGNVMALPSMKMGDDKIPYKESLVELHKHGLDIKWEAIISATSHITDIPKDSFTGKVIVPPSMLKVNSSEKKWDSHLYVKHQLNISDNTSQFNVEINPKDTAFLYDHNVRGSIVVPGAFYADIGLEVGKTLLQKPIQELQLEMEFLKTLRLTPATTTQMIITAKMNENIKGEMVCEFHSQSDGNIRARGCVKTSSKQVRRRHDIADIKSRFSKTLTKKDAYQILDNYGLKYGESFQLIEECLLNRGESFSKLKIPSTIMSSLARTHIHPVILDGMLQTCALTTDSESLKPNTKSSNHGLPVGVDSLKILTSSWSQVLYSYVHITDYNVTKDQYETHADACLMDEDGYVLVEVENLTFFSKLLDILVPREMKYFMTAKAYQLPEAREIAEGPANVVLIHADKNRNDFCGLESSKTVTICPHALDGDIKNALLAPVISKWGSSDLIFKVIFLPISCMSNDKPVDGLQMMETLKRNCLLFVEVIRVLSEHPRHPPVIVITENTQGMDNESHVPVNVCGSELWGQIRCLIRELAYVNVFLVDVIDMKENESVLKTFLSQPLTSLMACTTEIVITKGKIYAMEVEAASSRDNVSARRTNCLRPGEDALLQAKCSYTIMDLYLIPATGKENDVMDGWVKVDVQSVCLPVSFDHMSIERTTDFVLFRGGNTETCIESLEITGFVDFADMQDSSHMPWLWKGCKLKVKPKEGSLFEKVKVVVCYPEKAGSCMKVPRTCVVRQDEIPQYFPGQLSNWIRIWTIMQLIGKRKKIGICCDDDEEFRTMEIVNIFRAIGCTVEALQLTYQEKGIDENKRVDIIVLLKPLEPSQEQCFLQYLKYSSELIYMSGYVRQSLEYKIVHAKGVTCNILDERDIFSKENLPRIIPKVVQWVKHCKYVLTKPQHSDARRKLLRQVVDILPTSEKVALKRKVKECQLFDKQSCYVIVGGLTGLGWVLLQLLAEMGAGVIVIISRTGLIEERKIDVKKIQTHHGCTILCLQADVSNLNILQQAFQEAIYKYPKHPIRGIFQGAGIVDSSMFLEMTSKKFESVMLPKVAGSWNLHLISLNLALDYFVMHSSITGLFGAGGDSNYGAANTFLDSLAHYRRQKGLPGQSIDWGGMHVGLAATDRFAKNFESKGYLRMNIEQIRKCFVQALMQDLPQVVYTIQDWSVIAKPYIHPEMERLAFRIDSILKYKNLKTANQNLGNTSQFIIDWQALHCADQSIKLKIILEALCGITTAVTNRDVSDLQADTALADIGIDSLSAIHYTNIISDTFKFKLPATMVLSPNCTLQVLADYVMGKMDVEKTLVREFQMEAVTEAQKPKQAIERNNSASGLDAFPESDNISTNL